MVSIIQESFRSNLLILRVLGLYPPSKHETLYKIYAFIVYFSFTVLSPTSMAISLLVSGETNIQKISENLFVAVQLGCFILKIFPLIANPVNMRSSISALELDDFQKFSTEHPEIRRDCAKQCRMISWAFIVTCFTSLTTWGLEPILFENHYKLPVEVWLPFNPFLNSTTYVFSYFCVFIGVGHGALVNGALDPLIAGLACQAAGQFRMLKKNLERLSEYVDEMAEKNPEVLENAENSKTKILHKRIFECIEHHKAILSYVKHYEQVYSHPVFCQFGASVLVICISAYELTITEALTFHFVVLVAFIITMLAQIFLYSYFGAVLHEENDSLIASIYLGMWYNYDVKSRKALIILMERSKKPVRVTSGKTLDWSLVTFTTILRRAYSLFAVLNSYNK